MTEAQFRQELTAVWDILRTERAGYKDAVAAAVAAERERCAKLCDNMAGLWKNEYAPYDAGRMTALANAADAIRAQ